MMAPTLCRPPSRQLRSTSSPAAASSTALTIIPGPCRALTPLSAYPAGSVLRAMATIISVVAWEELGLINRICGMPDS